jgi:glyoxylase-like metal-dependent hydrolase (beta-lactamase superfamily II)
MFQLVNRRDFLTTLIKGGAALTLPYQLFGQQRITASKIADNFMQITGAGGNILVLTGPDGLLMVDGAAPGRSAELIKFLGEEFKNQRIQVLFNTDWHPDHTGSNEAIRKAGAKIIAHENTKLWLGGDFYCEWQNRNYKPRPAEALPTETFYTSGKMAFGNQQIEYGYLGQAHTDGDVYVYFPGANILVAGDAMSVGKYPILDYTTGGWIGGLVDANKKLLSIGNAETRVMPGEGPMQTRADLQACYDMLATMKDRLAKLMKQGMGPKDMIAAKPSKDFDEKWGNPELFISNAYRGMWGHVRELGGIV